MNNDEEILRVQIIFAVGNRIKWVEVTFWVRLWIFNLTQPIVAKFRVLFDGVI